MSNTPPVSASSALDPVPAGESRSVSPASRKLEEALVLLNEAARERRGELQKLIGVRYTHLKSALGDAAHKSAGWAKERGSAVADTAKQSAATIDESAHKNPWPWIGGAALAALIVGFLVGRRDD